MRFTIEDQLTEADRVATRGQARGTLQGTREGIAVTGQPVVFDGIDIERVVVLQPIGAALLLDGGGSYPAVQTQSRISGASSRCSRA